MPNDLATLEQKPMTLDELTLAEARLLAKDAIQAELEKAGLPLPRDSVLDAHIDALLRERSDFLSSASDRIAAKRDAYSRALRAIGIEPVIIQALDLDSE